jgi:choline dehydrogenase-like flavoprotein
MGPRNELFARACRDVGFTPTRVLRNESGCKGSAECFTLCPNDAKFSTDRRGIPEVLELGGTVYTSVAAHEVIRHGKVAQGVACFVVDPVTKKRSYKVEIRAKVTILAAGCVATPELLQRSKLGNRRVGENLRFHPGSMVMGSFDEEIEPWSGATQGYHCLDFLPDGIKLEALWATSSLMASRFPGLGSDLQSLLHNYRKMCSWDSWVSGDDSVGYVRHRPGRRADVVYNVGQGDCDRMAESMAKLCEMFFAVGATSVMTGVPSLPAPTADTSIIEMLRSRKFAPQDLPLASNHIFGTTAMGADPSQHAVRPDGALYDADRLYVCDTGLLPTTPAANPMLPTMALVHRIAEKLAAEL